MGEEFRIQEPEARRKEFEKGPGDMALLGAVNVKKRRSKPIIALQVNQARQARRDEYYCPVRHSAPYFNTPGGGA
jgi:hypothetical protein